MERVLLAIDGMFPDKGLVEYALDFSRRIKAQLDVLHLVDPKMHAGTAGRLQKQIDRAKGYFEKAMVAAAFAESGEHSTAQLLMEEAAAQFNRLLPEEAKKEVQYRAKVRSGTVEREIVNYVKGHRDIVLAIYDAATSPIAKKVPRQLRQELQVPLVVRNGTGA